MFHSAKWYRSAATFCLAGYLLAASATFAQRYAVDAAESQSLSSYLRQHQLPLVGAQVLGEAAGNRRIVLYGFVATQYGKDDAARKALAYVENGAPAGSALPPVENRIEIRPEIAGLKTNPRVATAPSPSGNESLGQVLDDINRFGIALAPPAPAPK